MCSVHFTFFICFFLFCAIKISRLKNKNKIRNFQTLHSHEFLATRMISAKMMVTSALRLDKNVATGSLTRFLFLSSNWIAWNYHCPLTYTPILQETEPVPRPPPPKHHDDKSVSNRFGDRNHNLVGLVNQDQDQCSKDR